MESKNYPTKENKEWENSDEMNVFLQDIDDQTVVVNKVSLQENDVQKVTENSLNQTAMITMSSLIKENQMDTITSENYETRSNHQTLLSQPDSEFSEHQIVVDGTVDKTDNNIKLGPELFEMICVIGKGAFGRVVLVRNRGNKIVYAMKIISKAQLEKKNNVSYMKSERDILTKIDFPFIVGLRFSFQSEDKLFLVMDYLQGGELFFHLMKKGLILENTTRFYMVEIILAIEHLHSKGIIHRDLKPENVLLAADGHICLTDFGLAKEVSPEDDAEGRSRTICGTNEYMAPEMITKKGYGKAVDWWSLGALMFEMSTGNPPFRSKNGKELNRKILTERIKLPNWLSSEAHSLLRGLLERNVEKRLGATKSTMFEIGGVTALKQHRFFKSIDWNIVLEKGLEPPIIPEIQADNDTSNFCEEFTELNVSESLLEVEGKPGTHSETYPGFSFICPSIDWSSMVFPDRSKMEDEVSNVSSTGKKKKQRAGKRIRKKKKNIIVDQTIKTKEKEEIENESQNYLEDLEIISLSSGLPSTEPSRCNTPLVDNSFDLPRSDMQMKVDANITDVVASESNDKNLQVRQDLSDTNKVVENRGVSNVEKSVYLPPSVRRMREEQVVANSGLKKTDISLVKENQVSPAETKYKEYLQALQKTQSSSSLASSASGQLSESLISTEVPSEKESWRSLLKSNRPPNPNRQSAYQPLKKETMDRINEDSSTLENETNRPSSMADILKQKHRTNLHSSNMPDKLTRSTTVQVSKKVPETSDALFPSLGNSVMSTLSRQSVDREKEYSGSSEDLQNGPVPSFLENKPKGVWGNGKPTLNYKAKPFMPSGN